MQKTKQFIAGLATLVALAVFTPSAFAQVSGAIFTTDFECNGVNVNIFCTPDEVYLEGGPRREGSAGLPAGEYYIQVTTPGGDVLGASAGTYTVGLDGKLPCLNLLAETGFFETDNEGGVYKVWVSQNAEFPQNESKTDNFIVKCVESRCGDVCDGVTPPEDLLIECPENLEVCVDETCSYSLDVAALIAGLNPTGGTPPYETTVFVNGLEVALDATESLPLGNNLVVIIVTDSDDPAQEARCEVEILVEDCDGPTVTCPEDLCVTLSSDVGPGVAIASFDVSVSDNCDPNPIIVSATIQIDGGDIQEIEPTSVVGGVHTFEATFTELGVHTVVLCVVAEDESGNQTEECCEFEVTVLRCPLTQGYWKTHQTQVSALLNGGCLPVGGLCLTAQQIREVLTSPVGAGSRADAGLILLHQLIAAELNVLNGAVPCPSLPDARTLISGVSFSTSVVRGSTVWTSGITPSSAQGAQLVAAATLLDDCNNFCHDNNESACPVLPE